MTEELRSKMQEMGMRQIREQAAAERLRAAAPDLFIALRVCADAIKLIDKGDPTTEHGWASEELLAIWERAQEALLKAAGK